MKFSLILPAVFALVAAAPAEESQRAVCPCEPVVCIQSWPESCYCQKDAARACYESCGGVEPTPGYEECGDITTSTIVKDDVETYQSCGSRGLEPCPDGTVCLDDPTVDNCGQACDIPGYCVPDVSCGGFIGKACPVEGQLCPDDPRDECDPLQGGSDCEGLCFTPQSAV